MSNTIKVKHGTEEMEDPVISLDTESVTLDFTSGQMEITGLLTWRAGPAPEVVWVWAYFRNRAEEAHLGAGSRSDEPIKLLNPLRGQRSFRIVARGHFHWWNNADVPKQGYEAEVHIAAASSESARIPVRDRDYSSGAPIPVRSIV